MRQALTIAARDLRATYLSPFGVGCTAAFAALAGVLLVFDLRGNQARLDLWFSSLFVALGLLAALLAMRAFAEEERSGTLELLLTSPVRHWQVAVGVEALPRQAAEAALVSARRLLATIPL